MKLKNKLLPLIGTAAIIATATPLALTSCKSNDDVELIDITDGTKATPTIDPMTSLLWKTQSEINTDYFKAVKENPDIFKQDFIYGQYVNLVKNSDPDDVKFNYLRVGCSTPTFGTVNISYPGEPDVQYPTISLTYKIQFSRDETAMSPSSYFLKEQVLDLTVTLKDVPFRIYQWTNQVGPEQYASGFWFSLPSKSESYIWKFNLNPWTIDYSYTSSQKETMLDSTGKTVKESNNNDAGTIQKYSEMPSDLNYKLMFGFDSYHLSALTAAPEFTAYKIASGSSEQPLEATTTAGLGGIQHGKMGGLYIPITRPSAAIKNSDLSVSVFAGYDANEEKIPLFLEQVLPEGSTATPVYMSIPTQAQDYIPSGGTLGDGWAAADTVSYYGSTYVPYQFPTSTFYDATGLVKTPLMPTVTTETTTEPFTFALPKSFMVQFSYKYTDPISGKEETIAWDQEVWLNQDEMTVYVKFSA